MRKVFKVSLAYMIEELNDYSNKTPVLKPLKSFLANLLHTTFFHYINSNQRKTLYRVLGMRRSGNHATINWILKQISGSYSFCNDIGREQHPKSATVKRMQFGLAKGASLIISYEEQRASDVFGGPVAISCSACSKLYDVLILRDPFNLFASRFAWMDRQGRVFREDSERRQKVIDLWKENARYYLEIQSDGLMSPEDKTILFNYNNWVTDAAYREELSSFFGFDFDDSGMNEVKNFGSGSSFDGVVYRRNAKEMKVLSRWKSFMDNESYKSIFADKELVELSELIFGYIEGTEVLWHS